MEPWVWTSMLLCMFGFLKEFRPSEPYVFPYLVGPWKNFTANEVNYNIYPVITYSYLAQLILVFLLTDILRYKPMIILGGVAGIASSFLLIYGETLPMMQVMSFVVGTFYATEIAYFTYIYAKVDRSHYQKVTSYTQSAFLMGRFLSSVLGQVLVSFGILDYSQLNYFTTAVLGLATVWSLFLPPVKKSVYFHNEGIVNHTGVKSTQTSLGFLKKCASAYSLLWSHFKSAYTDWYVLKWSIWWALANCGFIQGYFYIQILWDKVAVDAGATQEELESLFNGGASATYTLIGAAAAFGSGWLRLNWELLGEATLAGCAGIQGAALILAANATNIWVAYLGFIIFGALFHAMFTIVNAEVAKHINENSYGLVFGVNTFFALLFQSILTLLVSGEQVFSMGIRSQFLVYGGYFLVLGSVFALIALGSICRGNLRKQPLWLPADVAAVPT